MINESQELEDVGRWCVVDEDYQSEIPAGTTARIERAYPADSEDPDGVWVWRLRTPGGAEVEVLAGTQVLLPELN